MEIYFHAIIRHKTPEVSSGINQRAKDTFVNGPNTQRKSSFPGNSGEGLAGHLLHYNKSLPVCMLRYNKSD